MTDYFVSRHAGAIEWGKAWATHAVLNPKYIDHLTPARVARIKPGDTVIGTLPVQVIAAINRRGARYLHLEVNLSRTARGGELTAADLKRRRARLVEYTAVRVDASPMQQAKRKRGAKRHE